MASNTRKQAIQNMINSGWKGTKKQVAGIENTSNTSWLMDLIKKLRKSKTSTKTNPYRIEDKSDIMKALKGGK